LTWIVPRFHGPPILPVAEYVGVHTVSEFLRLRDQHVVSDTPFVLRDTQLWQLSDPNCYERLLTGQVSKATTFSTTPEMQCSSALLSEVFVQFQAGVLTTKVLDTPVEAYVDIMPTEWLQETTKTLGEADVPSNALSWHIVSSGTSRWHMDAVNDDHVRANADLPSHKPGGWVKLIGGSKNFWFLPRTTWQHLVHEGTSPLSDAVREIRHTLDHINTPYIPTLPNTLGEMLQAEPNILWGHLQVAHVTDGDLVWFPQSCLHKVSTRHKSHGFGGYI